MGSTWINLGWEFSIIVSLCAYAIALFVVFYDEKDKPLYVPIFHLLGILLTIISTNTLFSYLVNIAFNIRQLYPFTFYFSSGITSLIYVIFFNKWNSKAKTLTIFILYSMYFILTCLGSEIPHLLYNVEGGKIIDVFIRWFSFLLIIPFSILLKVYNINSVKHLNKVSVYFVITYTIGEIILTVVYNAIGFDMESKIEKSIFTICIFIVLAIINTFAYVANYTINLSYNEILELQIRNSELEKNQQLLSITEKNLEEMRRLRHDTKNQYGLMKILIQEKKYDELIKFFDQYGDGIIEPLSFIDCDNKDLVLILNMELSKARSMGVDFDIKIAVPEVLPFNVIELTSLFSNLIDNAIEASLFYKIENPIIGIRILKFKEMLHIEIKNSVASSLTINDLNLNKSSKKNTRLHGYGNRIIDQIIKEHNGTITRDIVDSKFEVNIMLPLK